MALTDARIKKAKPAAKSYKLSDGNGLWLFVNPNGTKFFRYRYRFLGKETTLSLGQYPELSLQNAREKRSEARKLLEQKINPAAARKRKRRLAEFKSRNTFEALAKEWYDTNIEKWTPRHAKKLWRRLEMHIFPALGDMPVEEVTALDLIDTLRKLEEDDKTEATHKILQNCRAIFQLAVLTQRARYNPASDLRGVLKPHKGESHPTIGHNRVPDFLNKLEEVETSEMNRIAVKMVALTFVRQGELRRAKWIHINSKAKEWRIPAEVMKMRQEHIVPLSEQCLALIEKLRRLSGDSEFLFPSQNRQKHPVMSENTINNVIRKMGFEGQLVGHGLRAMASTILNESGKFRVDVIERQLAHSPRNKVRAAYNRAEYLLERREMMQWWGAYLEKAGMSC